MDQKNLTIEQINEILNFQKIIDLIAQKKEDYTHIKLDGKYSPTELSTCIRQSYYARMFPMPYDETTYRNFLVGNIIHDLYQKNLDSKEKNKLLSDFFQNKIKSLESEKSYHYLIPLEKTNNRRIVISGRLDTIFFLHEYDKPIVVDYKTTADLKYNYYEPKQSHVSQINFYLGCTLADYGILVYIDKRNLQVAQHIVKWDPEKFKEMEQFAIELDKHLQTGILPKCDVNKMKEEGYCSYCNYYDKCMEAEKIINNGE